MKQIEANRENAKKSSGPRTSEGKERVALNALQHGLLAQRVVLPNEDESEFATLSLGLEQKLRPAGELEELLVDMIAAAAWRLRRLMLVEKGLFLDYVYELVAGRNRGIEYEEDRALDDARRDLTDLELAGRAAQIARDIGGDHEKAVAAALTRAEEAEERARRARQRAEEAEHIRTGPDALLGRVFKSDAEDRIDAFSRLARYEAHIQRQMFKALEELQRLQIARRQTGPDRASEAPSLLELEERNGHKSAQTSEPPGT